MSNPLVMAYMGDTIYEDYVREFLIKKGYAKIQLGLLLEKTLFHIPL